MWEAIAELGDLELTQEDFEILKQGTVKYKEKNMGSKEEKQERNEVGKRSLSDFPESILFEILVKLPPYVIKNAMLVCKSWHSMICSSDFRSQNFIEAKENEKLLIQRPVLYKQRFKVRLAEIDQAELNSKQCKLGPRYMGRVRSSCNGLLLVNHPRLILHLQVWNPATGFCVTVPVCPSGCPHRACGSALGVDPYTEQYKVVHVYADTFGVEIFDLGCSESTWKRIPGPWANPYERPFSVEFRWKDPVSVDGTVLHWYVSSNKYLISMDVHEEKFIRTRLPDIGEEIEKDRYTLIELGGYLSFVYTVSHSQIDVWVLEDFHGQVWSKKHSLMSNLATGKASWPCLGKLVPFGSADNGEKLIFKHEKYPCLYIYDTKCSVMKRFMKAHKHVLPIMPYKSSCFRCTFQG